MSTLVDHTTSPIELLRDITARAARLEPAADPTDFHLLQQRSSAHQTGIAAIWLGREEVVGRLSAVEARCRHTVRGTKGYQANIPSDTWALHDRSAERGIRQQQVMTGLGDSIPVCACCSQNIAKSVPLKCMLIDDTLAMVYTESASGDLCAVASTDRRVVQNIQAYQGALLQVSLPLTAQAREQSISPSRRQLRVLALMAKGLTDDKIAAALNVTSRTVRADVATLYTMFNVRSRFELGIAFSRWLTGV